MLYDFSAVHVSDPFGGGRSLTKRNLYKGENGHAPKEKGRGTFLSPPVDGKEEGIIADRRGAPLASLIKREATIELQGKKKKTEV